MEWSELESISDVNSAVNRFYEKIYDIFDICVPKCKRSKKYPVWFDSKIIKKLKEKLRKTLKVTNY